MGQPYLSNVDFLKNGVPASVVAMLVRFRLVYVRAIFRCEELMHPLAGNVLQVVATLGFAIMKFIGYAICHFALISHLTDHLFLRI